MTARRERRWLAAIVLVGLALRVAWVLWVSREPQDIFLDPTRYLGYARAIADGKGYIEPLTGDPTAYYPPGYPIFLGIVTWVSSPFTDAPWLAAGLVQALLGTATIGLMWSVARRLGGAVVGLVAAAVYAIYPNLIFHTGALLGETLYNFLFLAFLAVLYAKPWSAELSRRRILGAGVLLGLAILVRPISLAIIPIVIVGWLWARKDYRVLARWSVALLAGVALCLVPWTIRNGIRLHAFVPISTNTGDNLCIGHAEGATGAFTPVEACNVPYPFLDGLSSELKSDKAKQKIAIRAILDDPLREPGLTWRRTYYMWIRDGDHDALFAVQSYRRDRWMAIPTEARLIEIADWVYWVVVGAGLVGLVQLGRRKEPRAAVFVGVTLMTAAIPLLFFGDQRFKVPVIPLLIIAAACLADGRWGLGPVASPNGDADAEADDTPPTPVATG